MIGLAIKLLGVGRWLKEAATALLGWIGRNPSLAAIIALCGLLAGLWWHDSRVIAGKDRVIASRDATIADMKVASAANLKAQWEQKRLTEQHYKDLAHDADTKHAAELASARDATARWIAAHRLRPEGSGDGIGSGPAAEDHDPAIPAGVPDDPDLVAVSARDVQACTDVYQYAVDAHNWAVGLLADPNAHP